MSSTMISSERTIRSTTLPVEASIRERAIVAVSDSRVNQLTRGSRSIAAWAIASAKMLLCPSSHQCGPLEEPEQPACGEPLETALDLASGPALAPAPLGIGARLRMMLES